MLACPEALTIPSMVVAVTFEGLSEEPFLTWLCHEASNAINASRVTFFIAEYTRSCKGNLDPYLFGYGRLLPIGGQFFATGLILKKIISGKNAPKGLKGYSTAVPGFPPEGGVK
jgi:hypothetical protein